MKENLDQKYERLLEEKQTLVKSLTDPGVQMIFLKLKDSARLSLHDYDQCNFDTDHGREMAHRIQARRYVILTEIPRIIDEIINVDIEKDEGRKRWRFNTWLESIRANISQFFTSRQTE